MGNMDKTSKRQVQMDFAYQNQILAFVVPNHLHLSTINPLNTLLAIFECGRKYRNFVPIKIKLYEMIILDRNPIDDPV